MTLVLRKRREIYKEEIRKYELGREAIGDRNQLFYNVGRGWRKGDN